ncbi:MAG TPA: acetyl-CoA acetyltransferase, partial [Candidatus Binatia bacterium]|nr:acetyl-CoA acetyltransferase [Candidatus Binatia bacterium]
MANPKNLSGKFAIVGVAESDEMGILPHKSALQLHAEAARNAVADAGLIKSDIDAVFSAGRMLAVETAEYLGIRPRYIDGTIVGGCSFIQHAQHAMAAINAGLCEVALVTHGESGRSRVGMPSFDAPKDSLLWQFELPYGIAFPFTAYGFVATRHMHEYGTTHEQLAEVAVATRAWARLNPRANQRGPLTIEDVLKSPFISWPFHVLDCCLVTDAGGAYVLTSAERARDLKKKPVYILGTGEGSGHCWINQMPDFTAATSAQISGPQAFAMAGVNHKNIDVAMLYDAFTLTPIMALEDLGFCKKGEGGPFVSGQRTAPGGDFPMNTNGGGLSYTHTGMYGMFTIIE